MLEMSRQSFVISGPEKSSPAIHLTISSLFICLLFRLYSKKKEEEEEEEANKKKEKEKSYSAVGGL